jgi:hypothetical protein
MGEKASVVVVVIVDRIDARLRRTVMWNFIVEVFYDGL